MAKLSPMMQQYTQIKNRHKDHILFYRLGDFYEMFFEDAKIASKELELTLTGRDCGQEERAPMCGVPYHSASSYISKLIKKGYKVAICEQVEDPATAKGLVKREVVRIITPGTILESNMLDEGENNFISAIFTNEDGFGFAVADTSTGEVNVTSCCKESIDELKNELCMFMPTEVLVNIDTVKQEGLEDYIRNSIGSALNIMDKDYFEENTLKDIIENHFKKDLSSLAIHEDGLAVFTLGGLLRYLYETQQKGLDCLKTIKLHRDSQYMNLDLTARKNLELIETIRTCEKKGSLLWVLDKTKTAMGKRLIRSYIEKPLVNPLVINKRLNAVEEISADTMKLDDIISTLGGILDLERIMSRLVYGSATPRELKGFQNALELIPQLKALVSSFESMFLRKVYNELDPLTDIKNLISSSISDEPPVVLKDGGVIKQGYNEELDKYRDIIENTKDFIAKIELQERERTGIKNIKIGYNRIFGYYLEVTKSNIDQVPDNYIRKQTLTNCERYITEELKKLEEQILSAGERIQKLESILYEQIRTQVTSQLKRVQTTAFAIARLDVYASFATVALENNYSRPNVDVSGIIEIREGRHPVVEKMMPDGAFVPNDVRLDQCNNRIAVITGPNMAGKSTFMRQTAIIVLMSQIGSFVPAKYANIGVVDGIYTRVGASDDLGSGQSTFMVEMNELAGILNKASENSLLILDEIGRGTSTYDGMSIAASAVEYISDKKRLGAKTLFATHYHELTAMENDIEGVKNYNVAVKRKGNDVIFLRKIIRGGADESYGIYVAKLAGIPDEVVNRAEQILESLEEGNSGYSERCHKKDGALQLAFPKQKIHSEVEAAVTELNVDELSPKEALNILYDLKTLLK